MTAAVLPPPTEPHLPLPDKVRANSGHVSQSQLGWLRPTTMDTSLEEMKHRFSQDNYLYLKGALPRDDVLKMREHYFSQFTDTGLLDPSRPIVDGAYNADDDPAKHLGIGGGDPLEEELARLTEAHRTETYRKFVTHSALTKVVRDLMGWDEEVLLTRTMLRHNVPGGTSTGVHYDKLFLRGGSAFFLTAWVPIGDIRLNGGGLLYLEDSRALGEAIENDFSARARDANFTDQDRISAFNGHMTSTGILSDNPAEFEGEFGRFDVGKGKERGWRWLGTDYEAGDVVLHHPCSVHTSGGNDDVEGRIRLSTDLRFYSKQDFEEGTADARWMKFWESGDGL